MTAQMRAAVSQGLLRVRVEMLLEDGSLPRLRNPRVSAGRGEQQPCDVCGVPITAGQIQYDIEDSARGRLRVHLHCHRAWQESLVDVQTEDSDKLNADCKDALSKMPKHPPPQGQ